MRVIDAHVHVLDDYQPMAPFPDMGRVDRLLQWMDDAEVEKAVMLPIVADFSPDNNEECGRWARNHLGDHLHERGGGRQRRQGGMGAHDDDCSGG